MLILMGILASVLISAVEFFVLHKNQTVGSRIYTVVKNAFLTTLFSIAIFKYGFRFEHFLVTDGYGFGHFLLFFVLALVVGGLLLLLRTLKAKYFVCGSQNAKKSKVAAALKIVALILIFAGFLCIFATIWAKGEYGDLPADQILITYFSPTTGSDMVDYSNVLEGPLFLTLFLSTLCGLFLFGKFPVVYRNKEKTVTVFPRWAHRLIIIVLTLAIFVGGLAYGVYRFKIMAVYNAYFEKSNMIDDHYVDPRDANLQFPQQKRNLIHIYLESMENSYMSKDLGGYMDVNLIPELTAIAEEGYSFSHLDHQFGGPQAAVGTTWSVASMVNMTTGLPMKAPTEPNAYGSEGNFLPGAYTLGEILAEQGYEQTLMFGADADFGGLTYYFKSHGDFKIMDHKYAQKNGLIPPTYSVWWGFEDDKLFEFAKDELTRLSETGKPFNFIMETADTHRPDGYLSKNAPTPHENQYANVVAYSSAEVDKFVRWIQAQPFYENTTVVITGDHLSMESNFFHFYKFDPTYHRSQYNVILNPYPGVASRDKEILFNRQYANFDMFPTILSSMGVTFDGSRLGIGTDLFSGDKTLFEEYGFEYANEELEKKSDFYNNHILKDAD